MKTHFQPIFTPRELKTKLPPLPHHSLFVDQTRKEISDVLEETDPRILLIVGPCSIHDTTAAVEFASKLLHLANELSDTFLFVMRAYYEKPRSCLGWKGFLSDPDLNGSHRIEHGLIETRKLFLQLSEMHIPIATEILHPTTIPYLEDLISWGCIGARTSESQVHRELASGLPMPIAFKNNVDGNINVAVRGALAASIPHSFVGISPDGELCQMNTQGNSLSHIVLRGGENRPNYGLQSVKKALRILENAQLPSRVLIDCSHDNSFKDHTKQSIVFQDVIRQICEGNHQIRGICLESNLVEGRQVHHHDPSCIVPEMSITDSCMGWDTTEKLIRWAYEQLQQHSVAEPAGAINS